MFGSLLRGTPEPPLGDISGAHLNPVVTFGFWLARRLPGSSVTPYIASQVAGAMLASLVLRGPFGTTASLGATIPADSDVQSFILETVLTGLLMFRDPLCVHQCKRSRLDGGYRHWRRYRL